MTMTTRLAHFTQRARELVGERFNALMGLLFDPEGLRESFEMPHTLAAMGVDDTRLDELSQMAAEDPTAGGNPIPAGPAEMKEMFMAAIEGRLP